MKITVIGAGYVGLVSGVCLSDFGHEVSCVDNNLERIDYLKKGQVPIYEPGLDILLRRNIQSERLKFSEDLAGSLIGSKAVLLAVGTPSRRGDSQADLSFLFSAVNDLIPLLEEGMVLVVKSTVPVGTNRSILKLIQKKRPSLKTDVVSNPEFLREGAAIDDFMRPDRVIIGHSSEYGKKIMAEIYRPLYLRDFPIVYTDLESAELIKYASNAFLATKISFINELAEVAEKVGADIKSIAKGMGLDDRIGKKFLRAGPGYGGSCFPKDTLAFVEMGKALDLELSIIKTTINVNEKTKQRMVQKIKNLFKGNIKDKTILFLGVTFKPGTDDMREAPSLSIIPQLLNGGSKVRVVDPQGYKEGSNLLPGVSWYNDVYEGALNVDAIVILTEWNEFRALDLKKLRSQMKRGYVADLRNIYTLEELQLAGFQKIEQVGMRRAR